MCFAIRENPIITSIEERIAKLTGHPVEHGEGMQVVRYLDSGWFRPHWDDFDVRYSGNSRAFKSGGHRIITFLIYLNDLPPGRNGGETYFPNIRLSVKPKTGRALMWYNILEDGSIDPSTFHEGRPIPRGSIKYLITKWIRESL